MKDLYTTILEKLIINKDTGKHDNFTEDELHKDYNNVEWAMTKAEKQVFAQKYGVHSNKYKDIQHEILLELRKLRQKKKTFGLDDIRDLNHFEFKEKELYDYLDEEPIEFVKYLFEYYEETAKKRNLLKWLGIIHSKNFNYHISYADKDLLLRYEKIQKYLKDKGEL